MDDVVDKNDYEMCKLNEWRWRNSDVVMNNSLTPIWDILGISLGGICGQKIQIDLMTSHMFEKFYR